MKSISEPAYPSPADLARSRDRLITTITTRARTRRRAAVVATVLVLAGAGGTAATAIVPQHSQVAADNADKRRTGPTDGQHNGTSWAEWYRTLPDLKAHSDVVVLGTFTRVADRSSLEGTPVTDFEFTVQNVYFDSGRLAAPGVNLTVRQTESQASSGKAETGDDPLFNVSETCILFLRHTSDGQFTVVGGPTGRFAVKDGAVTPITTAGVPFSGTVDEFSAALNRP